YRADGTSMVATLVHERAIPGPPGGHGDDPFERIREFEGIFGHGNVPPDLSDQDDLFGVVQFDPAHPVRNPHAAGAFETFITTTFPSENLSEMIEEIKEEYHEALQPHEKLHAEELHTLLERAQLFREGNRNVPQATRRARQTVRRKQAQIRNINMYRGTNQEMAERLASGWFTRAKKWVLSKATPEDMNTAQHVINSASIDKQHKELGAFFNMAPDVTPDEFRKICDLHGGVTSESLAKYLFKLRRILDKAQAQNPDFKLELYDKHGKMLEDLVNTIEVVQEELESDEEVREALSHGNNFEKNIVEVIRAKRKSREERDNKLLEDIAGKNPAWLRWFKKLGLKKDWGGDYKKARETMKEQKMSSGEKEALLSGENLMAVAGALGTAYTVAETADSMGKGAKLAWEKGLKPGARFAGNVVTTPLGWGYRRLLAPTGRAAGKLITLPFRVTGRILGRVFKPFIK
ncbi:MAG TPA: hypothetical protein VI588_01250, partial [Candidatus Gracilibacteria bacterium]|nr:hypothetical protein [Candidatus Gracilibacteria bacterium]